MRSPVAHWRRSSPKQSAEQIQVCADTVAGRNSVYGPGMQTLDLALHREFGPSEGARFQFRAELFNALNHTNLGTPNRFVNAPQFGAITEAATPAREVQLKCADFVPADPANSLTVSAKSVRF